MKKIILICLLWVAYLGANAQTDSFPSKTPQGSPKTIVENQGGFRSHIINYSFTDTTQANLVSYFNTYNGAQIMTTQDSVQFWLRYNYKWNKVSGGGGGGGTSTDSAVVLKSVTQIASLSNAKVNSIFVTDTLRGGNFFRYTGSDAADNGMIFTDALGAKWLRQTSDDKVAVTWYGARQNGTDCRSQVLSALNYIYNHAKMTTLYFPYDSTVAFAANVYYIKDSIVINRSLNIVGDAGFKDPLTILYFDQHKAGLIFRYPYGSGAIYNYIANIKLFAPTESGVYDVTKHGITTSAQIGINNVYISGFDGDGLHITACATAPSGNNNNYGNANLSDIVNLKANDNLNGVFIEGCDANKIIFYNLDVTGNRRWGAYDNGFLGNLYLSPHSGGNGTGTYSVTAVTYGGLYYAAIPGHDGYFQDASDSNYNKQPDLNVGTYWEVVSPMATAGAWSATTRYYSGGPFAVVGASAWTNFVHSYTEAPNAPIWLNSRSKVDGGDNGAGVVNGVYLDMFNGYQYFENGSLVIQHGALGISTDPTGSTVFHSKNKSGTPYSGLFEGYNTLSAVKWLNTTTNAEMDLNGTDFQWYFNGVLGLQLNTTNLLPGVTSTSDLGSSSYRWKEIYADLTSGVGTKAVRYNPSTGRLTYADTTTGGGATPAGNYGNVQLNRFGSLATPATDSLDFDGGLAIKGTLSATALPTSAGVYNVRVDGSGNFSKQDTLADFTISNASHNIGDSLVMPVTNGVAVKTIIAGSGVTITNTDSTLTFEASSGGGNVFQDVNRNVFIGNVDSSYAATATAAGTTTLTNASKYTQNFTGATTQTVVLPDATTLVAGHGYYIMNNSTGSLTINKNGGTLLSTVTSGNTLAVTVTDISTSAGGWVYETSNATDTANYSPRITTGFGLTASGSAPTIVLNVDTTHNSTGIATWGDVTRIVDSLNLADAFTQQIAYADAGGGTTMTVTGAAITATGTGTAVSVGTGSNYSNKTRLEYLVTVASATAVAGWRQATTKFFLGNTAGQGGFVYTCYFGNATGASTATTRCFVGMQSSTAAPTDVEPSTLINMFGVGWDAADGNLQFFNNDGTGTATKTDLGGSFPVPTTDRSVGYKLFMYSAANSSVVSYVLTHLNTGATASGSVSSDLPANTAFLGGRGYMSAGGTSSVIGIALIKQYIKSQLD